MLKRDSSVNKALTVFFVLIAVISSFTGCFSSDEISDETSDGITFTDALGREVTVSGTPEHTAALIGSFAEVWMLSGGEICAAPEDAWDDFGLTLTDAVNIGGAHSPNLELLLSSSPDLVLASASTASNVDLCGQLENAGITVAYFDVDCFEDYLSMLRICTDITGRHDLFEKYGTMLKTEIESIKKEYDELNIPKEKRKILLLRASSSSVKAKGSEGTILGEMLSDLGTFNIADSDTSLLENLSIESVIKNEPYHIFVVTMGNEDSAKKNFSRMLSENPAWGTLLAVKENRLHIMERTLYNLKPNERWAEAYEKLSEILQQ